jgi:hypothetical protein
MQVKKPSPKKTQTTNLSLRFPSADHRHQLRRPSRAGRARCRRNCLAHAVTGLLRCGTAGRRLQRPWHDRCRIQPKGAVRCGLQVAFLFFHVDYNDPRSKCPQHAQCFVFCSAAARCRLRCASTQGRRLFTGAAARLRLHSRRSHARVRRQHHRVEGCWILCCRVHRLWHIS